MDFEFDTAKSAANREKHGIDDVVGTQQVLRRDRNRLEVQARSRRFLRAGEASPKPEAVDATTACKIQPIRR